MVEINYAELKIDHIIVFKKDTIFACCKENGCAKRRLFLVFKDGGAYIRNGRNEKWEPIGDCEARNIRNLIYQDNREGVAIYNFNGSFHAVTKELVLD